jgi:RNase P subunit RPR2
MKKSPPSAQSTPRRLLRAELTCQECPAVWQPSETMRWRGYLTDSDPPRVVLYCADCAEREFSDS